MSSFHPTSLTDITIVIVDDNADIRSSIARFLSQLGANVIARSNAIDGLQAVRQYRPDIVLSDISMPGRDGFEFLRDIREIGSESGGNVPVIAMTAFRETVTRRRTMSAGFHTYLEKPFGPNRLLEAIKAALKH